MIPHPNANRTDGAFCMRCGKRLLETSTPLELSCATGRYRDDTMPPFPDGESQGWFDFGKDCAARTLKEQAKVAA